MKRAIIILHKRITLYNNAISTRRWSKLFFRASLSSLLITSGQT